MFAKLPSFMSQFSRNGSDIWVNLKDVHVT